MSEWWLIGLLALILFLALASLVRLFKGSPGVLAGLVAIFPVLAVLAYLQWGGYFAWKAYQDRQKSQAEVARLMQTMKGPEQLIARFKEHLAQHPEEAKGWFLLGRLYAAQGDNQSALQAYHQAHELEPGNEEYTVIYAQALWQSQGQVFSKQVLGLFQGLLQANPHQPDALAMLAMAAFESKNYQQAIEYWKILLSLAPAGSAENGALRQAIAKAEKLIKDAGVSQ